MEYAVIIKWDSEAEVWTASSDDVKGLILEDILSIYLWNGYARQFPNYFS